MYPWMNACLWERDKERKRVYPSSLLSYKESYLKVVTHYEKRSISFLSTCSSRFITSLKKEISISYLKA